MRYTQWVECILLDTESYAPLFHFQSPAHDVSENGIGLYIAAPTSLFMPVLVQLRKSARELGPVKFGQIASVEPNGEWFALGIRILDTPSELLGVDFRSLVGKIAA